MKELTEREIQYLVEQLVDEIILRAEIGKLKKTDKISVERVVLNTNPLPTYNIFIKRETPANFINVSIVEDSNGKQKEKIDKERKEIESETPKRKTKGIS